MTLVNRWYQVIKLLVDHKGMSLQELQEKLAASPQTGNLILILQASVFPTLSND